MRAKYYRSSSYADCSVYQGLEACHCHILDPSGLLAFYAEMKSIGKSISHHDVYDDDFEEPFAPRPQCHDDSRRSSLSVDWDNRRDPGLDIEQDWEPSDDWLD